MKVLTISAILVFSAAALFADGDTPVGLVSMVKGPVLIMRAGTKTSVPAKMADLVGPGDTITTGTGGEAVFLYCPDSRSAKLPAAGEVTFTAAALQVKKGKLSDDRKIAGCRLPSTLALSSASQQQVGLMRSRAGSNEVRLHSPAQGTMIADANPNLRWTLVKDAVKYEVVVKDREERVLYKTTVTGLEAPYPASAPPLLPGQKYWWRVTAISADDKLGDAGDFFRTMPVTQAKEFKAAEADLKKQVSAAPQDTGPRIMLAFLYEENSMYLQAARSYEEILKIAGENDSIRSRLNTLLNRLGLEKAE